MQLIDRNLIKVPENRQRRVFSLDDLMELQVSIQKHGLFHPIVLREEGEDFFLVSGERRLRAISDLFDLGGDFSFNNEPVPTNFIPYVTLGELDELEREEAELEENVRRIDLSWDERALATANLASLRMRRAARENTAPPTVAEISLEVRGSAEGINQETTRREILVAPHLKDPEIKKAKNVDEAFKILRKRDEADRRVRLATAIGDTWGTTHRVFHTDSLTWLASADAEQFDVILTDPPYGIDADQFGDAGGRLADFEHDYLDSYENWQLCMTALSEQGYRICKPQAHLYMFCDIDRFQEAKAVFSLAGWRVHRTPIVYHKPDATRVPWPEHGPRRNYELILYAIKGDKKINHIAPDVITARSEESLGFGAQKPVAVYIDLLRRSTYPGDSVVDPFAGTGPIFPAAEELKCRATGIEGNAGRYTLCIDRLEKLKEPV